jgi:hypothetical protein
MSSQAGVIGADDESEPPATVAYLKPPGTNPGSRPGNSPADDRWRTSGPIQPCRAAPTCGFCGVGGA